MAAPESRTPVRDAAILRGVADVTPILGDVQAQIMAAMWRLEAGTVDQVRNALPPRYQGAYTTVQTMLNRLSERGFLTRRRAGHAIIYRPKISETQYLSRTIQSTLASASPDARHAALAQLIGGLQDHERVALMHLTDEVDAARKAKRP